LGPKVAAVVTDTSKESVALKKLFQTPVFDRNKAYKNGRFFKNKGRGFAGFRGRDNRNQRFDNSNQGNNPNFVFPRGRGRGRGRGGRGGRGSGGNADASTS